MIKHNMSAFVAENCLKFTKYATWRKQDKFESKEGASMQSLGVF
jgi:hypothetical protein